MNDEEKKKEKKSSDENIIIAAATHGHSQLHSEASSQLVQAYTGKRYGANGVDLGHKGRNLRDISNSKVNPEFKDNNIKQQAGFSAELLTEAEANKKNILEGNTNRVRTADGLGKTNDQINDLYTVDADGNILNIGKAQSKFLSYTKNPENSHEKIVKEFTSNPKYEKYMGSDISVPTEQYEKAKQFAEEERVRFLNEASKAKTPEAKEKLLIKAKKAETVRDSLKDSGVTTKDAIEARLNPEAYVFKKTIKDVHESSVNVAQSAMIVGGAVSVGRNFYDIVSNDKPLDRRLKILLKI